MSETIMLDPSEVSAVGRTELDITAYISAAGGVDWGDAAMAAYAAELAVGSTTVDYRIPNRQITIPLIIKATPTATFDDSRAAIQAKVAQIQGSGGTGKRITSEGSTVFFDIVTAQLKFGGGWEQTERDVDLAASLTIEALPDFYGSEETMSAHSESTNPELVFTETTSAGGDFPLGDRCRIVVDDDQGAIQRGLFWSWRGRHYSTAATAGSALSAEAMTVQDTATAVAMTGAHNGTVVTHGTVLTDIWTPVLLTDSILGALTHTGTNRVRARVYSAAGTALQTRLIWSSGDLTAPVENEAATLVTSGTFQMVDYGEIRFRAPQAGSHGWKGQVQARATSGTLFGFSIDRLWFQNVDESAGLVNAPPATLSGQPSSFTGRDTFDQTAGTLHTKVAAVGGAWDTLETSFDGTDFSVETSGHTAQRTEVSDTAYLGRPALLGSAVAACGAQIDAKFSATSGTSSIVLGAMARYVDSNNYMVGGLLPWVGSFPGTGQGGQPVVFLRIGGAVDAQAIYTTSSTSPWWSGLNTWYTLRLTVDAAGNFALSAWIGGSAAGVVVSGQHSALATGGALASGKVGFYDQNSSAVASTRNYDNFITWTPTDNAVIFASQSAELSTAGMAREDSSGTRWATIPAVTGDLPRMPNRSSAGTVEFMVKGSRGDFQTLGDSSIDDISARVYRRPCYLLIP